jgi:hypothetical protein
VTKIPLGNRKISTLKDLEADSATGAASDFLFISKYQFQLPYPR